MVAVLVGTVLPVVVAMAPFASTPAAAAAPWTTVATYPQAQADLLAVSCPSTTRCFAVGYLGQNGGGRAGAAIVTTADGGATWTHQVPPTIWGPGVSGDLEAIACPSTTVCFAVGLASGHGGVIIGTTDGGATWSLLTTMPTVSMGTPGIACPSTTECFALGSSGLSGYPSQLEATTDGGSTWNSVALPVGLPQLQGVTCPTMTHCLLVGGGDIIATADGGASWTTDPVGAQMLNLTAAVCPSSSVCLVGSDGAAQGSTSGAVIFDSTDGGATWSGQSVPGAGVYGLACSSPSDCYAGGSQGYGGFMIGTTDGGTTWSTQSLPSTTGVITGVSCPSSTVCVAAEGGGFLGQDSEILEGPGSVTGMTQTSVTADRASAAAGQSVTYSATVTATSGPGSPTGTVTFSVGTAQLCSAPLVGGAASCTTGTTPVGAVTVTGTYGGDPGFVGSSGSTTLVIGPTSTVVVATPSVATPGQQVSYSASVAAGIGTGTPTGAVTFTDGSTVLCTTVLAQGAGSCTSGAAPSGIGTVTGTYSGDASDAPSTGTTGLRVGAVSVTSVTTSAPWVWQGDWLQFTATAATPSGAGTPTGTVVVTADGISLCTVALVGGSGSCSSPFAPLGSDTVVASYSGDGAFAPSAGTTSLTVDGRTAATVVSVSPTAVAPGQPVTYSAQVYGGAGTGTGTVTFSADGTLLCATTVTAGTASCTSTAAPIGADVVTGTYPGDGNFPASAGTATLDVGATQTTVSATPGSVPFGSAVTYAATVDPLVGSGPPTGTVSFATGSVPLCTAVLSGGTASCLAQGAPVGGGVVVGTYSGDASFAGSTGSTTIVVGATTTTVTPGPPAAATGQAVSYAVAVAPSVGSGTPTGTVVLVAGGTSLCVVTLVAGSGSCPSAGAPPGTDLVVGTYSGDPAFDASTGYASVAIGATTTTVAVTPSVVGPGGSTTYTATVAPTVGTGVPTGTVTVDVGTQTACTATLVGAVGSCTSNDGVLGPNVVTASYSGDAAFTPSTGSGTSTQSYGSTVTTAWYLALYGHTVSLSASPTITGYGPAVLGTVTFSVGGLTLCSAGESTVWSCVATNAPFGTHTVTVVYSGAPGAPASSATMDLVIGRPTTTLSAVTPSPTSVGQAVTYSASVTAPGGGTPTGSVQFSAGGAVVCTVPVLAGKASCPASAPGGPGAMTAAYSGDGSFAASSGWTEMHIVSQLVSVMTLSLTPGAARPGQSVTFTARIAGPVGAGVPTGTVTFALGKKVVCTGVLVLAVATCSSAVVPVGVRLIGAFYPGDDHFLDTGTTATLYVEAPPTVTSFTPASASVGKVVTIRGTNLAGATAVTIGATAVPVGADTSTSIKVTVPPGAVSGTIQVTTGIGSASSATPLRVRVA